MNSFPHKKHLVEGMTSQNGQRSLRLTITSVFGNKAPFHALIDTRMRNNCSSAHANYINQGDSTVTDSFQIFGNQNKIKLDAQIWRRFDVLRTKAQRERKKAISYRQKT